MIPLRLLFFLGLGLAWGPTTRLVQHVWTEVVWVLWATYVSEIRVNLIDHEVVVSPFVAPDR